MLLKCCTQYVSKYGTFSSGQRTGKSQFSFQYQKCSNYCTIAVISHAIKVMLKILQARLQQYVNCELPDVKAGFRKGRGTRETSVGSQKKQENSRKTSISFLLIRPNFDCVDHNKLWKILKEMGLPDHPT